MFRNFRNKYIGDRKFYSHILSIAIPMILQNVVTNFVSLLDNIMVGLVGTEQMSGVAIVNQFMFIFNLSIFGAVSGPSIFGTQYYGKGDYEGQKQTFRFRLYVVSLITVAGLLIFWFFQDPLISLYLSKDDAPEVLNATLNYGKEYLGIMLFTLIPFAYGQAYASALRESGETKVQMIGSFSAVGINLVLDYVLIFGKFGFPVMGVKGAAIATLVAKIIEALVIVLWAHTHNRKFQFLNKLFNSFGISKELFGPMLKKSFPLFVNEFLWSLGMALISQCYSVRGLDVVAARNISSTINNLFGVVYLQLGCCISIFVGQNLGAGKLKEAKETDNKMIVFSVFVATLVGVVMLPAAFLFPQIYNTEPQIKELSTTFIVMMSIAMPMWAYTNACYFTLRSGGKVLITFAFDAISTWGLMLPLAFVLSYFTNLSIEWVFAIVTYSELIKCVVGYFMVRSDKWIVNLTEDGDTLSKETNRE